MSASVPSSNEHGKSKVAAAGEPPIADEILRAIRRILRKTAEYARQLASEGDLSVSELLCLRHISHSTKTHPLTAAEVAEAVQLSTATVSRILDRLEAAGLIVRQRGNADRRKVSLWLSPQGKRRVKTLPVPLHEQFVARLTKLRRSEQQGLLTALRHIVEMMGAADLDAAPVLTPESDVKGPLRKRAATGSDKSRPAPKTLGNDSW